MSSRRVAAVAASTNKLKEKYKAANAERYWKSHNFSRRRQAPALWNPVKKNKCFSYCQVIWIINIVKNFEAERKIKMKIGPVSSLSHVLFECSQFPWKGKPFTEMFYEFTYFEDLFFFPFVELLVRIQVRSKKHYIRLLLNKNWCLIFPLDYFFYEDWSSDLFVS